VQLEEMARKFPRWFYTRLRDLSIIDDYSKLRVVVKNKCRGTEKGRKVSFHFIFNLVGTSTSHEFVCEKLFSKYAAVKKSILQDKQVPVDFYDDCAVGVDLQTLKGERGYSTPYSKKRDTDPDPTVTHREVHDTAGVEVVDLSRYAANRCKVIYLASYTCPDPDTVTYAQHVLRKAVEVTSVSHFLNESAPGSRTR